MVWVGLTAVYWACYRAVTFRALATLQNHQCRPEDRQARRNRPHSVLEEPRSEPSSGAMQFGFSEDDVPSEDEVIMPDPPAGPWLHGLPGDRP